jgi:ribonucleoside-diphosphate reductase alpha chain
VLNKELSNLIFYKNYSKLIPGEKRKETFEEMIGRIIDMHTEHLMDFKPEALDNVEFSSALLVSFQMMKEGVVFGSQRANQFGGKPILNKNMRLYNCSATYIDRPRVFAEIMHTLLCGAGVGCSVRKSQVAKIPMLSIPKEDIELYVPEDSIEG